MEVDAIPLEKAVWRVLQKKRKRELLCDLIPLLDTYPRKENYFLEDTYLPSYVHWDMETTSVSINVGNKIYIYIYIHEYNIWMIIFKPYERRKSVICDMGGPWGHFVKLHKPDRDKYCMILLICGILKNQTDRNREVSRGLWWKKWGLAGKRMQAFRARRRIVPLIDSKAEKGS